MVECEGVLQRKTSIQIKTVTFSSPAAVCVKVQIKVISYHVSLPQQTLVMSPRQADFFPITSASDSQEIKQRFVF